MRMVERERRTRPKAGAPRTAGARGPEDAASKACRRLAGLIGFPVEGVSAVCRAEDGWRVSVDVLEVPRIPDTTSLLATYEVEIDRKGALRQYRRVRRYRRGEADN
jgi:hypothetical protein